jgi:hypothetical protein
MESIKKYKRRSFFARAGAGTAGYFLIKAFPFNLFSGKEKNKQTAKVELNPLAVSRKLTGEKNG